MNDIVQRTPGYSNQMMFADCEIMLKVMTTQKETIVKNGRKNEIKLMPKYKIENEKIERMKRSCEYYQNEPEEITSTVTFRDYQLQIIEQGMKILHRHGFLYLAMEVRTGKTLISLGICEKMDFKNVLFVTKKKAMSSIQSDYDLYKPKFNITIINYDSLHLVKDNKHWDMAIFDESHCFSAFAKPGRRALLVKEIIQKYKPMVILMSGTPTPESYSQMYHQVYGIPNNPFSEFKNFYRFCDKYVNVTEKMINSLRIKDYSKGKETILEAMVPYTINYTQKEAGFESEVVEEVLEVEMKESTYALIKRLRKELVVQGKDELILGDTPVKLMTKIHQLCSGTIKFESGNSMIIDKSKAEFIRDNFASCKIGIFYKFKEEFNVLKEVYGDDLTTELDVFDSTDKSIALQILSGREGISLRKAEYLVYYNIDFSATSYWQSRDRMTTKDRLYNNIYWVFSKGGIEREIYKAVIKKKDYTVSHFKKQINNLF